MMTSPEFSFSTSHLLLLHSRSIPLLSLNSDLLIFSSSSSSHLLLLHSRSSPLLLLHSRSIIFFSRSIIYKENGWRWSCEGREQGSRLNHWQSGRASHMVLKGIHDKTNTMISPLQFDTCRSMAMYETSHQINMWDDPFKAESSQNTDSSTVLETDAKLDNRLEDTLQEMLGTLTQKQYEQEATKPTDKVSRRLAQNREAARKSRIRKKAYIQQLESSRIKLAVIEQELEQAKRQGLYTGGHSGDPTLGLLRTVNPGVAAFEMEYGLWIEEQNRHLCELRAAVQSRASDIELRILVDSGMRQYDDLFRMKTIAAKSDVFYVTSGTWRTSVERFFLWIGGFRPSELLKILSPQLDTLMDQQLVAVYSLQQSSMQAEDALSQGLEKLQQTLAETIASDPLCASGVINYMGQMTLAMGKLDALESFVNQADNLRKQALQQMYRILTVRQAARALLALGDYLQRLRTLSSHWEARSREPA